MSQHRPHASRRRFVTLAVRSLAATQLAAAHTSQAAPVRVRESDPKAIEVSYTEDASKSSVRKDATETCNNCNLYSGKDGAVEGSCALFQDNLVSASGWCTAWAGL